MIDRIKLFKRFCFAGCAALFILLYTYGAVEHSKIINLDVTRVDQAAYLSYARNLYETNYNYVGGRNRMPVYSFLLSSIYNPNFTQNQFFTRGKAFNIALSVALLPGLFWLFYRTLPFLQAVNFWLIVSFTVFVFRAGYVQAELLFYILNFCSFLLMYRMLIKPSWKLGLFTGVVLGITHLTKASIMPGFLIFTLCFVSKGIYELWHGFRDRQSSIEPQQVKQKLISHILSLTLVILTFLGTIYPYISTSYRFFGQHFYNVNSTFYIWYDDWEQTKTGTGAHGDSKGWPRMPPEEIPSLSKYLREHSTQQIGDRFAKGFEKIYSVVSQSYGYFKYFLLYLAIGLLTSIFYFRTTLSVARKHFFLLLFCLGYFITYLLVYVWYAPIADGNRFILAQFLPFMFFAASVICVHARHSFVKIFQTKLGWFDLFNWVVLGMILFEILPILNDRIITTFAGT